MKITLYTAPAIEPITLDELKVHLRFDSDPPPDNVEDALLTDMIAAARQHVEDVTRRQLLTATWDYFLDQFPRDNFIKLPFGNLQTVSSVKYKDCNGTETIVAVTTGYLVEANGDQCGRITLPYGVTWPATTLYTSKPISIRFACGWTTAALVPAKIRTAVKMICADMYEDRGERVMGQVVTENRTVDRLLASAKLWDVFE
jgi:uncharacterized phiE125 gp8 family phage protein